MAVSTRVWLLGAVVLLSNHLLGTLAAGARNADGSADLERRVAAMEGLRLKNNEASYVRASPAKPRKRSAALASRAPDDYVEIATSHVRATLPNAEFRVATDHYIGANGIGHVYFKQTAHGLDVDNANFNVNVGTDGTIFSYGHNFYNGSIPPENPLQTRAPGRPGEALKSANQLLALHINGEPVAVPTDRLETYTLTGTQGAVSDPEARLVYFARDGRLVLTWRVETDVKEDWLLTYVDTVDNTQLHGVVSYRADLDARYYVYPWEVADPREGERQHVENPWRLDSSPFTFHGDGEAEYNTTRGNNAVAHDNPSGAENFATWQDNHRPIAADWNFSYPLDFGANYTEYRDASITQLFYTVNVFHDILYALGWTEVAGNFQANNHGKGGIGNDMINVNAQDGSRKKIAYLQTPPEGYEPRLVMGIWDWTGRDRDSVFDQTVVTHEYAHGLTMRVSGGPANAACLALLESVGMGEGWSDFFSHAVRLKANTTRETEFVNSAWAADNTTGIRLYPYTTDLKRNPLTYARVNKFIYQHDIGEVWCVALWEVMWNLIDKHGLNAAQSPAFDGLVPTDGKFLAMKLVMDALALAPCNPTMVEGRDAILDADLALTGGSNRCEIVKGFAKRGLGMGAEYSATNRIESFVGANEAC